MAFLSRRPTQQNVNYLICADFVESTYKDLLNISIPGGSNILFNYSELYLGKPEVILYSYIKNNISELLLYSPNEENHYKIYTTFSLKNIIPLIRIGDILTYTGHTNLIYEIIKDSEGNVIDAIIMESSLNSGKRHIKTKFTEILCFLYLNSRNNTEFEEGREEGTITLNRLSTNTIWNNINNEKRAEKYAILRFINEDSNGDAVLKYIDLLKDKKNQFVYNDKIKLSDKNIDRIKFKHLYIEKIVNKYANNIVEIGDILNYKIIIKNNWKNDYEYDLIVTENISEFVIYEIHYENKDNISFNYDKKKRKLIWNIGKLKANEEIIINYIVKIINGKPGDIIESNGFIGNIPSSLIKNVIGINLNKNQMNSIEKNFERLKNKYNGKKFINEIYKHSLNIDLKFDKFDITKLIIDSEKTSRKIETFKLNKNYSFYNAILNKYWSCIMVENSTHDKINETVTIYKPKNYESYEYPERRADYINKEDFKTGDILYYINKNDITYNFDEINNKLIRTYITYEEGEYAFIYIKGKGFVGINIGNDGQKDTKDDRNEFTAKYYKDNNLTLYEYYDNPSDEILEIGNLQTLFGKDYYVILRPSLCYDFPDKNNNKMAVIIVIIFITIILSIGILILYKYFNMKMNGKEFNFINLKQELLFKNKTNCG